MMRATPFYSSTLKSTSSSTSSKTTTSSSSSSIYETTTNLISSFLRDESFDKSTWSTSNNRANSTNNFNVEDRFNVPFEYGFPYTNTQSDWFQAKSPYMHNYDILFGSNVWTPLIPSQTYTSKVTKTINTETNEKKEVFHSINILSPMSDRSVSRSSGGGDSSSSSSSSININASQMASPIAIDSSVAPRAITKTSPFVMKHSRDNTDALAVKSDFTQSNKLNEVFSKSTCDEDTGRWSKNASNTSKKLAHNCNSYNTDRNSTSSTSSSASMSIGSFSPLSSRKSCSSSSSSSSSTTSTPNKKLPLRSANLDKSLILCIKESFKSSGVAKLCNFCKNNGEPEDIYRSHNIKDSLGKNECPILRMHVCPKCGESGDYGHTDKHCPKTQRKQKENKIKKCLNQLYSE